MKKNDIEIINLGCRLNIYEREIIKNHIGESDTLVAKKI